MTVREKPSVLLYLTGVLRKLFPTLKLQEPEHMEAHTDFYTKEAAEDYLVFGPHEEPGMRLPAVSAGE